MTFLFSGDVENLGQPPAVPLERGKQHPNPLIVPHTLGDFNFGGHPQTLGRR
jgi:hypothetical protein